MGYLLSRNTINGAEGSLVMTVNGKNILLAGIRNLNVKGEIMSNDMRVVGTRKVQNKNAGVKLTGQGNIYYGTPHFAKMVLDYIKTGIATPFNIQIDNYDPGAGVGRQSLVCYDCELTGEIPLAILNSEESMLNFDFNFSVGDVDLLESFTEPAELGG